MKSPKPDRLGRLSMHGQDVAEVLAAAMKVTPVADETPAKKAAKPKRPKSKK
jgi:hypothetical protein